MRLACVLLTALMLLICTHGYSQTITWSGKNVPIKKVFLVIKRQTGYLCFYNSELLKGAHNITMNVKNATLTEVLKKCFKNQPFDYAIENKTIVITEKIVPIVLPKVIAIDRDILQTVTGKISDEKGDPIEGATVAVADTTLATAASPTGSFTIRVPKDRTQLVISSIGFEEVTVPITKLNDIVVVLKPKGYLESSDVVVIGYGTAKKMDLTGSVSTVNIRDIGDRQNPSLATLIQGKIAGVDVSSNSIRIRGVTSFNNTDPLVVIDGFLGGSMETVNPNDIENIEVLKDASSTAIYGSRGSNGVILVTTKKPKAGPTKISVNINSGIANTPKKLDVLNASQYIDYVQDDLKNAGRDMPDSLLTSRVRKDVTDWQDEVFKTAHSNSIDVNFSGGSDRATFYVSLGYKHADEIYIGPSHDDFTARLKNNFTIKKWLRFGDNLAFTYRINKGAGPSRAISMLNMQPYIPVRDTSNYWGYGSVNRDNDLGDAINPVASSALVHPVSHTLNYQANVWAEIEPIKGLIYHIQTGVTGLFDRSAIWTDKYDNAAQQAVDNSFSDNSGYALNPVFESYLTYAHKWGKHDVSLMAGNTTQNFSQSGTISIYGQNYANTDVRSVFNANNRSITDETFGKYAFISYFGRLNYQFNDKYLVTVNLRRDGSPRFAPQNRWGTFPSVAVAWKLQEENFIKRLDVFDQLKLRASWGSSGNDAIGNFKYLSQIWTNGVYYPFGTNPVPVAGATIIEDASHDIKWESTTSKTIGLDLAFMRNALTVSAEYFVKNSNDILFAVPRPESLGYGLGTTRGNAIVNSASCSNIGYELQAGFRNSVGPFHYFVEVNYTRVKNKVKSLGLGQAYLDDVDKVSRTAIGYPIGYFYGYTADGIFKTRTELDAANAKAREAVAKANPQFTPDQLSQVYYQLPETSPGDVRFKDLNEDGFISSSDDRSKIGNSIPTDLYGASIYLNYKKFDLSIFFNGIAGSQIYFGGYEETRSMQFVQNQEAAVLNRWRSEKEPGNGIIPRAIIGDPADNSRPSTLMVSSGNYLKLRQLSFGFNLSDKLTQKAGFTRLRIYGSGSNLFTITRFPEYDPEFGSTNLNRGVTSLNYPIGRSLSIGIQAGL